MVIDKRFINRIGETLDLDQIGVTTADPLTSMLSPLEKRIREERLTPFEEKDLALRISPEHLLAGCQTIITLAVPYHWPAPAAPVNPEGLRGLVSRCARSIDYHLVVENKAAQLVRKIEETAKKPLRYKILADRSPLLERELARRSNLGLIGENCTLINPVYGSYVALGTILLDIASEPDLPNDKTCLKCGRCREACPTGALIEPYIINPHRCLSYLSQASGVFPAELRASLGSRLYGCDRCQEVCPLNQEVAISPLTEFGAVLFPAEPDLLALLRMTRKEFDTTIRLTAAGWRGKTTLQRNTVIALGNSKNRDAVKPLARFLENDPRPLLRLHAVWSLGQIGGREAKFAIGKSLERDPEASVRQEALNALTRS
jgi:epoxyqueuosine reductase